ncbi:MAG: hypothetical protein QM784_11810 [Polyangiaceae bacterium]
MQLSFFDEGVVNRREIATSALLDGLERLGSSASALGGDASVPKRCSSTSELQNH